METFEQFCERTKMNPLDPYSLLAYSESQASALSLQNSLGTPELTLELWEAMGKAKGWGQPAALSATPADQTPVVTLTPAPVTPAASSKAMLQRVRGILLKTKYGDFENLVNQYGSDGEISRADRRAMRKELGLNRKLMRGIAKGLNGGDASALNAYTKGLEKRSYVDNGKLITEGEGENFDPDAFNTAYESAKYKGTDMKAVANLYNLDVLNWRKNTTITYDPTKNAYMASGFNGGEAVDVTNSDWFKKDTDRQRAAQLTAYKGQVDAMDSAGLAQTYGNQWGAAGLAGTLGIDSRDLEAYNKKDELGNYVMSSEDRTAFKEKLAAALKQKLDSMRTNAEGGFDFAGNVLADQITKYLIQQQKANPEAYSYLDEVSFAPEERYASAGRMANARGAWSLLQKNGGTLRKQAQAYKKGGAIQYAGSANSGSDNQPAYTPNLKHSSYFSELILIGGHKNGGNINMTNVNYFLEGGAMAPQAASAAAPAQGGQDIQAQVMQLVLAAMSGDKLATQAIQLIMQAAQLGDQQAAQIAQMIQEVAKQMQGQAQAAKYGAKLSYLKSLKSGCPDGYEVSFHKAGGRLCKECVKKAQLGAQIGTGQQQRKLVRHGSFNNSAFGSGDAATAKVKWLQNQMFANGMNGHTVNDDRVDGKWGALSLALAQKQGWTIGAGGDTLMRGDRIYYWDANRNEYVEDAGNPSNTPKKSAEDELWYLLSDSRQREAQNWINRQNAAGKQVGIADWFAMNERNHYGLLNAIKAGQMQADFVRDLMLGVAGPEALGALSKTAGPLLSKALGTVGRAVGKGVSAANNALEEGVYLGSRLLTEPSKVAGLVRSATASAAGKAREAVTNAGNAVRGTALRAGNAVRNAGTSAAGAVRNAGTRAANNITSGWRNVMNKAADAVTPKVTPFEMAPQGGEMYNGLEFIAPFKKGGCLNKKLACGGKKLKNGAELDKKGGKACAHSSKAECKKKHANGGTLTLEGLQAAYKSLNA